MTEIQVPSWSGHGLAGLAVRLPERFAGWLHTFAPRIDDRLFRLGVCVCILLLTVFVRRALARFTVNQLKRISGGPELGIDHRILNALLLPLAALLLVCGVFAALGSLRLPPDGERLIDSGARVAFIAVLLWACMAAGGAAFDHAARTARSRNHGLGAFLPLIKRIVGCIFVLFSLLVLAQALGADVRTFLAGLGIGGLAVALAAQDTIANMFGSFVVVMDHPFHIGDAVRIAGNEGTVEDIGLRSTRLRTAAQTLIVLPNKLVATEAITNLSRIAHRRVEQTIRLPYDTSSRHMKLVLQDVRELLAHEPGVDSKQVTVYFTQYGDSSLIIEIVYYTADPEWRAHLEVRERVNLRIMDAIAARGLSLAVPVQKVIPPSVRP